MYYTLPCSPVDVYFVSCSHDTTARLWSCDLTYPLRIFAGHTSGVNVSVAIMCGGIYYLKTCPRIVCIILCIIIMIVIVQCMLVHFCFTA